MLTGQKFYFAIKSIIFLKRELGLEMEHILYFTINKMQVETVIVKL